MRASLPIASYLWWCFVILLPFVASFVVQPQCQWRATSSVSGSWRVVAQQSPINASISSEGKSSNKAKPDKKKIKRRTWDESYDLVLEYCKEHGNANVPKQYKKDPKLGAWVMTQRARKGSLPADKIAKLDALNFTWDGVDKQKYEEQWEEMFQRLKNYKQEEGDCNVSTLDKPNLKLALWVQNQRANYRDKRKSLTPERIAKLESIGFVWRLKKFVELGPDDHLWGQRHQQLVEYKQKNGDCNVPFPYKKNPVLGNWVNTQRQWQFDGILLPHRKEQLDDIGFEWDFVETRDQAWQIQFNQLKLTQDDFYGLPKSKQRQTWAGQVEQEELRNWEINQQNMYKRNTLSSKREALLEELGYWESLGISKD